MSVKIRQSGIHDGPDYTAKIVMLATETDADLPTTTVGIGSIAFTPDGTKLYVLGADRVWVDASGATNIFINL